MKTRRDFESMFGPTDAGFEQSVLRTLNEIGREGKHVRAKMRVGLVAAIILSFILAAAALAAAVKWGVMDFVTRRTAEDTQVLPEATALLQDADGVSQTGGDLTDAVFSVRQAVYDGDQAYVVVEVKAKEADAMLTGSWSDPSGRLSSLMQSRDDSDVTIEEYGNKHAKTRFLAVEAGVPVGGNWFDDSGDAVLEEDGTMVLMLQGACKEALPELTIDLSCYVTPFEKDADGKWKYVDEKSEKGTLSFTLKLSDGAIDRAEYAQPLLYPGAGVRVDRVALALKPMAIYYEIAFTVTDLAAYKATDDGVFFEFLGADGRRIASGAMNDEVSRVGDGEGFGEETPVVEGGQFIQKGSLTAMPALPDAVTLSAYNCWEKNRYEAHEIRLK